jgi:predicted RNase H-like nuclease (RuvC/YqgF family)
MQMNETENTALENEIETADESLNNEISSDNSGAPLDSEVDRDDTDAAPSSDDGAETRDEDAEIEDTSVIEALQNEIKSLKEALNESHAIYNKLSSELIEFSDLYPEVSLSSIPDSVWESSRSGIPLSAAYALAEKKAAVIMRKARTVNDQNKSLSSGAVGGSKKEDFFSPDEVRAMSAGEVKANYEKIISSMSKWH